MGNNGSLCCNENSNQGTKEGLNLLSIDKSTHPKNNGDRMFILNKVHVSVVCFILLICFD